MVKDIFNIIFYIGPPKASSSNFSWMYEYAWPHLIKSISISSFLKSLFPYQKSETSKSRGRIRGSSIKQYLLWCWGFNMKILWIMKSLYVTVCSSTAIFVKMSRLKRQKLRSIISPKGKQNLELCEITTFCSFSLLFCGLPQFFPSIKFCLWFCVTLNPI